MRPSISSATKEVMPLAPPPPPPPPNTSNAELAMQEDAEIGLVLSWVVTEDMRVQRRLPE